MKKKVIVIGGGLTGLSAGITLQKLGIDSEIFELSDQLGGMCTAWSRKGYRFDGCIHWMVGTKPHTYMRSLYESVGALNKDTAIYNSDNLTIRVQGEEVVLPLNLEKFQDLLLKIAPEDSKAIISLCKKIKVMRDSDMLMGTPKSPKEFLLFFKSIKVYPLMFGSVKITMGDFVSTLKSPKLKEMLLKLMPSEFSLIALIMMLGTRMGNNAGYPIGGATAVIGGMESLYKSLGGKLHLSSKVQRIVVEDGKVSGIKIKDNFYPADGVIAACDMYDTLYHMLGGKYKHGKLEELLQNARLFDPICVVSFGIKKKLGISEYKEISIKQPFEISPNTTVNSIGLRCFDFDLSAAPEGESSIMVMLPAELDYWQNLRKTDFKAYIAKKNELAALVADAIENEYMGFKELIEVTDVATPATYVRYANLYKASWEGFAPLPELMTVKIKNTVEGVKGLVLSGQWTTPGGGICTAVHSGIQAAKAVNKKI